MYFHAGADSMYSEANCMVIDYTKFTASDYAVWWLVATSLVSFVPFALIALVGWSNKKGSKRGRILAGSFC